MHLEQDINIPKLRQDLRVYKSGADLDGSPTWMLYDPLSDNYFKIGWFEFECLQRFETHATAGRVAASIANETTLDPTLPDVKEFITFLMLGNLLVANTKELQDVLLDQGEKKGIPIIGFVMKHLYSTIPLFEPSAFLSATYPYIRFLFTRGFFIFVLCLLGMGIFLTLQRWDDFLHTFSSFFSLEGLVIIFATTAFVKIFHEFGHAFMAHKYGVPVPVMGMVLIVVYPILYTETTNVWRLYDRRKRIHIAAGGLLAEITLASFALMMWHMLPPGFFQNVAYFVGFVSLAISVFVNLNPLMKFDGYYLVCDIVKIDNLQSRAINFFKWMFRRVFLGFNVDPPEPTKRKTRNFLITFGVSLMIYRFFLYLGISVLVYHFFFKPLGAILMSIVLFVFFGMPVMKEVRYWYEEREHIVKNLKPKIFFIILIFIVILSFLPLQNTVKIPAVLQAGQYSSLHTLIPAKVTAIHVENNQEVKKGDLLFNLKSDELDAQIELAEINLAAYQKIKEREQSVTDSKSKNLDIDELIQEARAQLKGLKIQRKNLEIRAPFDGVVKDITADVHIDRWVASDFVLARVVNQKEPYVTGYISSENIKRVRKNANAAFMSDAALRGGYEVSLVDIAPNDTRTIAYPELSSLFGGRIPSDFSDKKNGEITSRLPLYQLNFKVLSGPQEKIDFTKKGVVALNVQPISIAGKMTKKFISLFIREAGI